MTTHERLSLRDGSLISSFAEHIQRYEFALEFSRGKRVLDAGCGTGYGSHFLAANGAHSVLGLDISEEALCEARDNYQLENLSYDCRNVETLESDLDLRGQFDVVVNFENLEHLQHPKLLVRGVATILSENGKFITSTPNGGITVDKIGRPANVFHIRELTTDELRSLLSPYFANVSMYGQWLTHGGLLRKQRAKELFEQLCESYYNPMSRVGRTFKRALGKKVARPPRFTAGADSVVGDHVIHPLRSGGFPWAPAVLMAVCEKGNRPSQPCG